MAAFKKEKRLITAALPYTNNVPHLGNIVGSHLPADIFARYCRLVGHETVFIGGTDEHGTASEIAAYKYGITPKELCDFFYKIHKDICDWFNLSYDNFSRTSKPVHHQTTTEFLKKIWQNGYILEKTISLPFCQSCQRQLSDRYVEGICPYCGYEKARGDQCENCSKVLDPAKLKTPSCAVCHSKDIHFVEKKHLFLDLEKLSPALEKWINSNKHWRPQVRSLALGWIEEGLKPRCITRNLKWGVNVPFKGYENLVFYVWVDAPIGYISSTKEWHATKWKTFWQNKDAKIYHFIGKDNIPFHTIFFPGMIMANGTFNLPHNVIGLQYLNYEGGKFSKSQNRGVFCENLAKAGLKADYWRFYSVHLIPETKDTEFYWKEFQEAVNNKLIANFANFINRTLSFLDSKFAGELPQPKLTAKDKDFWKAVEKQIDLIINSLEKVELRHGLEEILALSALGNKYFQENGPWKDLERAKTVIYICANLCLSLSLLIQPYLPATSQKILQMLNLEMKDWKKVKKLNLGAGHQINKPELLFHKLEDEQIEELKAKTSKVTEYFSERNFSEQKNKEIKPAKTTIFPADLHVAKILSVADHPHADSLYILQIDLGAEKRQLVAGLKKYFSKEQLLHKKIVVCANLKPAKIRGIESKGMLLAADDGQKVALLEAEKSEPGAAVSPEGYTNEVKELAFEEFIKLDLTVANKTVVYNNHILKTKVELIRILGVKDGARVR